MTPQSKPMEQEKVEKPRLQEEFVRQVEDRSLPAQEVLSEQQEDRAPNEGRSLFVP